MKISAKVGASTRLYMKKFHKSQRDPNPSRRVNQGWLLRSYKYLLQVDRRRVGSLRRVEANPSSCKGGLSQENLLNLVAVAIILAIVPGHPSNKRIDS